MDMMKLMRIQTKLNAPKSQFNKFGGYSYRSCEDILGAVKPFLETEKCTLLVSDDISIQGDRVYVVATASLCDAETGECIASAKGWAREAAARKGRDESQITGSSSSYARKYALNGLLAIDDNRDSDSRPPAQPAQPAQREPAPARADASQNKQPQRQGNGLYRLAQWLAEKEINADYFASLMFKGRPLFKDVREEDAEYAMRDTQYTLTTFNARAKADEEDIPMP